MPEAGQRRALRGLAQRFNSLQARMALILGLVLAPSLLYSFWQALDAYQTGQANRINTTVRFLEAVAGEIDAFFTAASTDLKQTIDAFADDQGPICTDLLQRLSENQTPYRGIRLIDAEGETLCAAGIGTDQQGFPSVAFALHGAVETSATFAGNIDPTALSGMLNNVSDVPPEAVIGLVDAQGSYLGGPSTAARLPNEDAVQELIKRPRQPLDAPGRDASERTYFAVPASQAHYYVIGGLPAATTWAWLNHTLLVGLLLPPLMLSLAIGVIWIASDYLVNRHIRRLALATRAYSQGESDAFLHDLRGAPNELRELAAAFARMAQRVYDREERLRDTIEQREENLREIHHRIKNNLQIVTSLLNLRARRSVSPEARESLAEAQARIKALALVHRSLYALDEQQQIDFAAFLHELATAIEDGIGRNRDNIRLQVSAEFLFVSADQAIPLALMVVEAVSNAYKHAFPDDRGPIVDGRIRVELHQAEDRQGRLTIADNGVGGEATALSLTLIRMFVKQLQGQIEVAHENGLRLAITFPRA